MIRKKKKRPKPQARRVLHAFCHFVDVVLDLDQKGVFDDIRTNDPVAGSGEPVTIIEN